MGSSVDLPAPDSIDAVLFDAGGVLLLPDSERGREAVLSLGCESNANDWKRAYYVANLVLDQMEVPHWPTVRRAIAHAVGVASDRLDEALPLIESLVVSTPWVEADDANLIFQFLEDAGYPTAVVSNALGTVETELEQAGICSVARPGVPRVGVVIDSTVVGVSKPDPRIFQLALDALDIEPSRAIYVGDTIKFDVLGALAAGLRPIHMDPFHLCDGDHSHVANLGELMTHLSRS